MSIRILSVVVSMFLAQQAVHSSQTAQVRMYCVSVQLDQATDPYGDILGVNSMGTPAGAGELIPWGQPAQREIDTPASILYTSVASLYDSLYDSTFMDGSFSLYLPELVDENGNGYPDFFEVSQGVDTNAYNGAYHFSFPVGSGAIWTTWLRVPGSPRGTCSMYLPDYQSTFNHQFEIREYTGTLSYTPASNSVSGVLTMEQTGATANTLTGTAQFAKNPNDRMNQLVLQQGTLTDASSRLLSFTNHVFLRNANWPTNYSGFVEFDDDGTQNTPYPYSFWVLSITDTNDVDQNGIPDFSDDPQHTQPTLPRAPQISLTGDSTSLMLRIAGDTGHVHTVQTATDLSGNWQDVVSLTLTTDPQTVPVQANGIQEFWRVIAK